MVDALQNAAVGGCMRHWTSRTKRTQLLLQGAQGLDPFGHMADVLVEQAVDFAAVSRRLILNRSNTRTSSSVMSRLRH